MDLKESEIIGKNADTHWYYRSKAAMVREYCRQLPRGRILDVGAGSGFFARDLLSDPACDEAICIDPSYLGERDEVVDGKPFKFRREIKNPRADLFLFMDVLEHVESDVGLLRQYMDGAKTGSHALISVPAFQFLWSEHDVFLEHYRRYTLAKIKRVAENANLTVVAGSYFFGSVFPIAVLTRTVGRFLPQDRKPRSQLRLHHPAVNSVLSRLCQMELRLARLNKIAGLTVFCLARKER